jgi:hypothetical protein
LDEACAIRHCASRFHQPVKVFRHCAEVHSQSRQRLAGVIVQFSSDSPSFFILEIQKPRGEVAQALVGVIEFAGAAPHFFFHLA